MWIFWKMTKCVWVSWSRTHWTTLNAEWKHTLPFHPSATNHLCPPGNCPRLSFDSSFDYCARYKTLVLYCILAIHQCDDIWQLIAHASSNSIWRCKNRKTWELHLPSFINFAWILCICCIQVWHWKQIFHGIGREYDPSKRYKVDDMINLHLTVYSQLVDSILSSAVEAYGVEHRFNEIRSFWMEREFKLAKHVLDSAQKSGQNVILLCTDYFCSILYLNHTSYFYCRFLYILSDVLID